MATDPWTGARLGDNNDAPLGGSALAEVVAELGPITRPRFASTADRDAALAARVAAGNTVTDGLHCYVTGLGDQTYIAGAWTNETWSTLALASGWGAYTTGYDAPGVQRSSAYQCELRGWVTSSGAIGAGVILSTPLPSAMIPHRQRSLLVPWEDTATPTPNTGLTRFEVTTAGQILSVHGIGANTFCLFDGQRYRL